MIHQSFKTVRVGFKGDTKLEKMYKRIHYLRSKNYEESEKELNKLEEDLAGIYAQSMYVKIKDE